MDDLIIKLREIKSSFIIDNSTNFIGLFLFGSQNYHLSTEESDIDCILLLKDSTGFPKEAVTEYGKIKIYSLEKFIKLLSCGVPQAYEILYTKYRIVNPLYEVALQNFISNLSDSLDCEKIKAQLYKKLEEHFYHILWIINKKTNQRYNKKRLYWAIRVCNQLQRINDGESFESSLIYRDLIGYDLMQIKTVTNYLSIKDFNTIYKNLIEFIRSQRRYSKDVLDAEEKCFSNLYANITELYSNYTMELYI